MFKYTKSFSSFSVNDIKKAKTFYSDVLGLDVSERNGMLELNMEDHRVLLYPKPDHTPATFTVLNFAVKHIEKTVKKLTESGVQFEQYAGPYATDEHGISRSEMADIAWFKDPAGNIISVLEDKK